MITIIDTIVKITKEKSGYKKKSNYKNTYKRKEHKPTYAVQSQQFKQHNPLESIHYTAEGTIKWTYDFLRSLEWKRFEEVCME